MVKNLAIIPARSGSKRVKDKNIMPFMGKPMMAWTIEAAINSGVYTDVIVSTDSPKYAEIAKSYGAWVPFLREEASDDFATIADVVRYTISELEQRFDKKYDNLSILQVTCPLRNEEIIKNVYNFFIESKAKSVLTCFKFDFMNPWWAFLMKNNEADFILSSPMKTRSQDNKKLYCPTGACGFIGINEFLSCGGFYDTGSKFFPINWKYAIDIDNYEDIDMAEAVYYLLNKGK